MVTDGENVQMSLLYFHDFTGQAVYTVKFYLQG
jgi:hypothetical protein